jgi:hypothetical protein
LLPCPLEEAFAVVTEAVVVAPVNFEAESTNLKYFQTYLPHIIPLLPSTDDFLIKKICDSKLQYVAVLQSLTHPVSHVQFSPFSLVKSLFPFLNFNCSHETSSKKVLFQFENESTHCKFHRQTIKCIFQIEILSYSKSRE